jgi:hypothetical protein
MSAGKGVELHRSTKYVAINAMQNRAATCEEHAIMFEKQSELFLMQER